MGSDLLTLTADILVAHIEHNQVSADALPGIVRAVYQALATAHAPPALIEARKVQEPAVPIQLSLFPDYIICLEDGRKLTLLTRYLHVRYGLTPHQYRQKWGLPHNYPMVAPNHAKHRSDVTRNAQLARRRSRQGSGLLK